MPLRGTTRLLGILGNPLSHSYSPAMHNSAIADLGLDYEYLPFEVDAAHLPAKIGELKAANFAGANVTLPHKQAVIPLLDELSELSRKLGAVNTILHKDGKLRGDTTDAAGFIAAFEDKGFSFDGKSVAILGSGGSARTLSIALPHMRNVKRIGLVARSASKAALLAEEVRKVTPGTDIAPLSFEEYAQVFGQYDVVVNATSVGMFPDAHETPLPSTSLAPRQIVYDLIYNPEETRLLREAAHRGCSVLNGLGMLVHQGMLSFEMWTGVKPDPASFYAGIRKQQSLKTGRPA